MCIRDSYGTVAVIGGGMVGCETAEYLAARGCKVSVIEMMDKIACLLYTSDLKSLGSDTVPVRSRSAAFPRKV